MHGPSIRKLTPVLFVERIEPCLLLWERQLGWSRTVEVPEGEHLGFVILQKDGVELMYQSRASLAADLPAVAAAKTAGSSFLFLEVADLAAVQARLGDTEIVSPLRQTFYGSRELTVREPGGHLVTFAQFGGHSD